jgi:hypothetical protein
MRFNDVGVADISSALYNKWNYLTLGYVSTGTPFPTSFGTWGVYTTTYSNGVVTSPVGIISAISLIDGGTFFQRQFLIGFLDGNTGPINAIFDNTNTNNIVDSFETIAPITKNNLEQIRITIKTEILR